MNTVNEENFDILKAALEASSNLLPAKSRERYEKCYTKFCEWRINKQAHGVDENIMLAYFFEKVSLIISYCICSTLIRLYYYSQSLKKSLHCGLFIPWLRVQYK